MKTQAETIAAKLTANLTVQQADRDAAIAFWTSQAKRILAGDKTLGEHDVDDSPLVQMLAAHRQSAYAEAAKVAEAEEELGGDPPPELAWCANELRAAVRVTKRNIAAAIIALGESGG